MKLKRNISKTLTLGILLNYFCFYSNASDLNAKILNRYETLEGECITMDNSTEGELHEIEIFGNSVQGIQSVGDLYVDENGKPILDSEGREQYKIDIISSNDSLILTNDEILNDGIDYFTRGWQATRFEINSKKIKVVVTNKDGESRDVKLAIKNHEDSEANIVYIFDVYTKFDKIEIDYELNESNTLAFCSYGVLNINVDFLDYYDIKVYSYDLLDELHPSIIKNKTTILLPTQLEKVGDVADRLYWDNKKGRYIIEKKVDSSIINGTESVKTIETNITSKLKIPTYEEKTYIFTNSKNGVRPVLKVTVDKLFQIAKSAVEEAEMDSTIDKISLARTYVNMLSESLYKDQLHERLNQIYNIVELNFELEKKHITSNTDIYIKPQNTLSMSLSTNNISFEDFNSVEDLEYINAVKVSVNSSLPYQLNAYLESEIQNADKTKFIDKSILNIKSSNKNEYKSFVDLVTPIVLEDNQEAGENNIHSVDIKLSGSSSSEADIYKTAIKFEAEQK